MKTKMTFLAMLLIGCETKEDSSVASKVDEPKHTFSRGDEMQQFLKKYGTPARVYPGYLQVNDRTDIVGNEASIIFTVRWENVDLKKPKKGHKSHLVIWFKKSGNDFSVAAIYSTPISEKLELVYPKKKE